MNTLFIFLFLAVLFVAFAYFCSRRSAGKPFPVSNAVVPGTVVTHLGKVTRKAEAAITAKHLLYKQGTADDEVLVCGAEEMPLGTALDTAAIDENVSIGLLGGPDTRICIADGDIVAGELVYTAAGGKVSDLSASAGTYYCVGQALTAAGDGEEVEVNTIVPIAEVVAG